MNKAKPSATKKICKTTNGKAIPCCLPNGCGCVGDLPVAMMIDLSGATIAPEGKYLVGGTVFLDWVPPDLSEPICLTGVLAPESGDCFYYTVLPCGSASQAVYTNDLYTNQQRAFLLGPQCLYIFAWFGELDGETVLTVGISVLSKYVIYHYPWSAITDFETADPCRGVYTDAIRGDPTTVIPMSPDEVDEHGIPVASGDPAIPFIAPAVGATTLSPSDTVCPAASCDGSPIVIPPDDPGCFGPCSSCSEHYSANVTVTSPEGTAVVPICVSLVLGMTAPDLPPDTMASCVWVGSGASIFCTLDESENPIWVLDIGTDVGSARFTQAGGPCPGGGWSFESGSYDSTTGSVSDWAAVDDCTVCTATDHATGADRSGSPAEDSNWLVADGVTEYDAYVVTADAAWVTPPSGSSWISHSADKSSVTSTGNYYTYTTTITLPADADLDNLVIPFDCACDEKILEVLINGHSTGIEVEGFAALTRRELPPGFWVIGDNTIEFNTMDTGHVEGLLVVWGEPNCDPLTTCEQGMICPKTYTVRVYFGTDTLLTGTASRVDTSRTWTGSVTGPDYEGPIRITCINEVSAVTTQSYRIEIGPVGSPDLAWEQDAAWTGTAWDCPSGTDFAQAGVNDVYPDDPYIELT